MTKAKFLIAAALGFSLTACGSLGDNRSMYSIHQPVVERSNYVIDVNAGGGDIPGSEQTRVAEWFDALKLGYGDRVSIDYGDSYASPAVRQSVAELAGAHGLLISDTAPVINGSVVPGTIRIVVSRSRASVPTCPDWSTTSNSNFNSSNHSNYGCATNSNLAAMVADPEDLVRGRESAPIDNDSGNKAVNAYRSKAATTGSGGGN